MFHTPTVFITLSFVYIAMPIAVWVALSNQQSKTIQLWCAGGELLAIGLLMFGLRSHIPAWASYPLANTLTWVGALMQVQALRSALHLKVHPKTMVFSVLIFLVVFEYLRLDLGNQTLRFTWALLIFLFIFSYIAFLAVSISHTHQLKSSRVLALVYGIGAIVLCVRMLRVYYGYAEPDVVAHGVDSLLVVFSGFLAAVFGNFSFVGMFLERTRMKEMAAVEERARQEESARLADEIAQLERQRTLGMMSYSLAHEFSQPLTAILMDAHSAKTALTSEQVNVNALNEAIQDIERNANRTKELIDRIRDFIRPSPHDDEKVDMKVLAVEVKQLLMHDIRHQKIEFEWDFENEDGVVVGDKVQLSQILLNVYRNAIQAIAELDHRKIFVSVGQQDDRVVVRVRDTGPGVTEALRLRVGMPFVTTKTDGLGVGLSISKSIAEKHGGSLTIANAVDGGALVELNLPAANF
jgi:C4-dicarboxylate-specific signal transduction histidine kinase